MKSLGNYLLNTIKDELRRMEAIKRRFYNTGDIRKEGTLVRKKTQEGRLFYIKVSKGTGENRRFEFFPLGSINSEGLTSYIRSVYYKSFNKRVASNAALLEKLLNGYQDCSHEAIMASLPKLVRETAEAMGVSFVKEDAGSRWANMDYKRNPKEIEFPHYTVTGEPVRSKGEALIYNLLVYEGVPFRYECALPVVVDGIRKEYYPDFTIRCSDGAYIFIEYSGMLSNPDYMTHFAEKTRGMQLNGITINQNLYLFFDKQDGTIDTKLINDMVTKIIVPRVKGN